MENESRLLEIFKDDKLIDRVKNKLPELFQIAEEESSRAGKIGMEVGSVREKIIIALFIYKFGLENVDANIPITEKEVDVKVFNEPVSIKTITGKTFSGIKMIWTVDPISARTFFSNYKPVCHMILVQINWDDVGAFYFIPKDAQIRCFNAIGRNRYIKLPKEGTNPRGVEITKDAIILMLNDKYTKTISVNWKRSLTNFNLYERWVELWQKD
jgi:hypothetical protein